MADVSVDDDGGYGYVLSLRLRWTDGGSPRPWRLMGYLWSF